MLSLLRSFRRLWRRLGRTIGFAPVGRRRPLEIIDQHPMPMGVGTHFDDLDEELTTIAAHVARDFPTRKRR